MNSIGNNTKLYDVVCRTSPEVNESYVVSMISMINQNTTVEQFESAWKKNPNYKLEMMGPLGPCLGGTCLHMAVSKRNLNLTKYFLKKINNPDPSDWTRKTPLIEAVMDRFLGITKEEEALSIAHELLAAGSDVNLAYDTYRDGFNRSPLTLALSYSDLKLTKLFLQYGAQKFFKSSSDGKSLIKQKLTDEENAVYKQAKREIKEMKVLFLLGSQDPDSPISWLPKEIVFHILTCGQIQGSNQKRVNEAKLFLKGLETT